MNVRVALLQIASQHTKSGQRGVAGCPGIPGQIKSVWVAASPRNTQQSIPEPPGSRFTIHQPQPADHLKSKRLGQITIRRGWMLPSCLGVTTANHYGSKAVGAKGTPCFRAGRLGSRPLTISVVNSFGGIFVWIPKPWIRYLAARPARFAPRSWGAVGDICR